MGEQTSPSRNSAPTPFVTVVLVSYMYCGSRSSSMESILIYHHVSRIAQNRKKKKNSSSATAGSPTSLEESEKGGIQPVMICTFTTRYH